MKQYDYLIVGSGLFGAVFAHEAQKAGKHCLVVEKRQHTGGNIYCEEIEGIHVHKYGAHIFHTDNKKGMAICEQPYRIQPIYQFTHSQLQRKVIQPAFQHEYISSAMGRKYS